jgi:hypothetical protein
MLEPPSAERNKLDMRDKLIEMCLDFVEPTRSAEELNKYTNEHLLKLIEEVLIAKDLSKIDITDADDIDRLIGGWRASGIRFDYSARRLIDRWHAGEIDRPTFLTEILRVAPVLADLGFEDLGGRGRSLAMEEKDLSETDITAIDNTYSENVGGALADDVLFGGWRQSPNRDWDGGDADDSSWLTPAKRW